MIDRFPFVCAVLGGAGLLLFGCESKEQAEPAPEPTPTATAEPAAQEQAAAEPEPAAAPGKPAELGQPAPDFTLTGVDGKTYELADFRGKTVVLEWFNPDCPFVKFAHTKGLLSDLAKKRAGEQLVWLSINSGAEGKQGHGVERNKEALASYGMANPILLDPSGVIGKAYGAEKTPHMFVIDSKGVLVYRGGVDNAPMGTVDPSRPRYPDSEEGALIDYITGALKDLESGGELRLSETPPYGCSVKYQS